MAKYIIQRGSDRRIVDANSIDFKLAKGTYMLKLDENRGEWYLDEVAPFTIPNKIYGDLSLAKRCIEVYRNKERNFGLLLNGLKGSGKTMLLRKLAIDLDQPVIIINENFGRMGTFALQFLSSPSLGDCTIVIDEFEKKFSRDDDAPLALLDGPASTHHFFILTMNEMYINENLRNRPGRVYYSVTYAGLSEDVVRDVIEDLLVDKTHKEGLIQACDDIPNLSFDMLLSIIHDMNLFHQSAKEVIPYFGFCRDTQYVNVFQRFNGNLVPLVDSIALSSSRNHYYWLEDVKVSPDPTVPKVNVQISLDTNKAERLRKNVYLVKTHVPVSEVEVKTDKTDSDGNPVYEVPSSVRTDATGRIPVEFELHLSAVPRYDSRAY